MNDPRFDYLAQNRDRIEKVCIESVQKAVNEQATDPIARVGELLLLHSPDPSTTPPSSALRIAELEKELATTKTELATANARIAELEAASDDTPLTFTCEDVTMFFLRINSWNGTTPLLVAAQHGDAAVVAKLLANGAQVDEAAVDGQTPLCASAAAGHEAVVGALLAKGAQVAKPNNDGDTPLSAAAQNGYEAVVKTLLANMAEQELAVAPRSAEETKVQEAERGLDSKLIDNLTSRFPHVSREEVSNALRQAGGHAGRAAGALQKRGHEEQRVSFEGAEISHEISPESSASPPHRQQGCWSRGSTPVSSFSRDRASAKSFTPGPPARVTPPVAGEAGAASTPATPALGWTRRGAAPLPPLTREQPRGGPLCSEVRGALERQSQLPSEHARSVSIV